MEITATTYYVTYSLDIWDIVIVKQTQYFYSFIRIGEKSVIREKCNGYYSGKHFDSKIDAINYVIDSLERSMRGKERTIADMQSKKIKLLNELKNISK